MSAVLPIQYYRLNITYVTILHLYGGILIVGTADSVGLV